MDEYFKFIAWSHNWRVGILDGRRVFMRDPEEGEIYKHDPLSNKVLADARFPNWKELCEEFDLTEPRKVGVDGGMIEWTIKGRFTFDGHALVEAATPEEAKAKFDDGDFEFDHATASICNWSRHGKPESCD